MTIDILTIKPLIRDFVAENISKDFNAVYWYGERANEPQKPYCLLSEVLEIKDKRTSTCNGNIVEDKREIITTKYKTFTLTISLRNEGLNDFDEKKEFAYYEIKNLEKLFERPNVQELFYPTFVFQSIGDIRPLHEVTDGGYIFRYDFDLTLGYNEEDIYLSDIGEQVEINIENKVENKKQEEKTGNIFIEVSNDDINIDVGK